MSHAFAMSSPLWRHASKARRGGPRRRPPVSLAIEFVESLRRAMAGRVASH